MDIVATLESLDARLHPRQRVGLRFYLWQLVNAALSFLSFWRHCYGCGTFKGCTCSGEDAEMWGPMGARVSWSVAMSIWSPKWDDRAPIAKPIPLRIVPQSTIRDLAKRLHVIDQSATSGPWKVHRGDFKGQDWMLASFGAEPESDLSVVLTTDHVHASECGGEGAGADADLCAAMRNALPEIIAALRWKAAVGPREVQH